MSATRGPVYEITAKQLRLAESTALFKVMTRSTLRERERERELYLKRIDYN